MEPRAVRIAIPLIFLAAQPGLAHRQQAVTWNKPNVSYQQYRADADECAATSRYVVVHIKPDTMARLNEASIATLMRLAASFNLTKAGTTSAEAYFSTMDSFKSEKDIARRSYNNGAYYTNLVRYDVADELQVVLERCLTERGYKKFALTNDQRDHLARLKRHTAERDLYLYSLGARDEEAPTAP